MKWATCNISTISEDYAGIFLSETSKRQIKDKFKRRVMSVLIKRGYKKGDYEIERALREVEDNIQIWPLREGQVVEVDMFGGFNSKIQ